LVLAFELVGDGRVLLFAAMRNKATGSRGMIRPEVRGQRGKAHDDSSALSAGAHPCFARWGITQAIMLL
jgi:hypothetical protein